MRSASRLWLLFLGSALLSGCVYYRVLTFREQFCFFDKYFAVSGEPDLSIELTKPVLTKDDVIFLLGSSPTEIRPLEQDEEGLYVFEQMTPPAESLSTPPMKTIPLTLRFRKGELTGITIPRIFLDLFPRELLIEILCQTALADSSLIQRKIYSNVPLEEALYSQLPEKQKSLSLLGAPFKRYRNPGVRPKEQFIYKYRARGSGTPPEVTARLYYSEDDILKKIELLWGNVKVEIALTKKT